MKKLLFIIPSLLVGCVTGIYLGYDMARYEGLAISQAMPESAQTRRCETIREFEIFQATSRGALAHGCEETIGRSCRGQLVFIPNQRDIEFFDGKRVRVTQNQCFVFYGVHRYRTVEDRERSVPIVWIRSR